MLDSIDISKYVYHVAHGSCEGCGLMSKPSTSASITSLALHGALAPLFIAAVLTDLAAIILLLVVLPIIATVSRGTKGTACNVKSSS